MQFDPPLQPARLVRRYKRFLADMLLPDGRTVVAHCPNPGSMLGLAAPGSPCWLSAKTAKGRKLDFGWEIVETADGAKVGINTGYANRIVAEALARGVIAVLPAAGGWRPEVTFGAGTRFDFCHTADDGQLTFLEVKSVTLSRAKGLAEFPDSRTERGAKHLRALMSAKALGHRAVLVFLAQRGDCPEMRIAQDIDPAYAETLIQARNSGVEILSYACEVTPTEISLVKSITLNE
ncbi:DNA/RNA nuclease SfsA [Dongia rigui]|uniref:Sugar fermentation stimulation protein homolog n=1 Tax=Dongia rigui TaxID=940149 RepID=A0ABU5E5I6_9PROT|nr:DNA/RNA nuclease SfsA [Dongia rigui]MDY0874141.1 DNA/RNA nuclease SfsA [Dongia rigui]